MKSHDPHTANNDHANSSNRQCNDKDINKARSIKNNTQDLIRHSHVKKKPDPALLLSAESSSHNTHNSHLISKYFESSYNISPARACAVDRNINCGVGNRRACYDSTGGVMDQLEGVVCSMCGDVGIAELLFVCAKCTHRPQHIYCGRSYPNLCGETSICNWCLHEEDSMTSSMAKLVPHDTAARAKAGDANYANARSSANIVTRPIKYPAAHIANECTDEVLVKNGHGKAFEYLLLIAAQSQLPQVISEANCEIKEINHSARMIHITNPKMGSSDNKANCDLDTKGEMGSADSEEKISNGEGLMTDTDSKQDMELQRAAGLRRKLEEKMEVCVYGGNIPKRQRCSKGISASLKCRKKGLQLSPARPNYRRYKLLADVVC